MQMLIIIDDLDIPVLLYTSETEAEAQVAQEEGKRSGVYVIQ